MIFRVGLRRNILPTIILAAVGLRVALNASTGFAASEAEAVAKAVQSSSDMPSLCKGGTEAVTKKVMATTMALMQSGTISNPHFHLAAACGQLGRLDEAREALTAGDRLRPDVSEEFIKTVWPFANPANLEAFLDGVRKAGLPEG